MGPELARCVHKILWVFEQTRVGKMFHKSLEIGKERMLGGLFQKDSRVDFCSICSNLVEKRSERMVVVTRNLLAGFLAQPRPPGR